MAAASNSAVRRGQFWSTCLPAAKLYKPICDDDAKTLANDPSAHLVYGLATGRAAAENLEVGQETTMSNAVAEVMIATLWSGTVHPGPEGPLSC